MADSALVEGIKVVGGIAGLLTGAFTIYDRAIRSRPRANLKAEAPELEALPPVLYLTIKNPAERDILIEEFRTNREREVIIGSGETNTSVLRAGSGITHVAVVGAGEERRFQVKDVSDSAADLPVTIEIVWRPITARFGRAPLRLSTGMLRYLINDAMRRRDEARELCRV